MKKLFTSLVVILPIITVYNSPVRGVDLGTFLFVLFAFYLIINKENIKISVRMPLLLYLFYIVFSTCLSLLFQSDVENFMIMLRTGKFLFLIFIIILVGRNGYFDLFYGLKLIRVVTLLAVAYIFLQTITYNIFGVLMPRGIMSAVTTDIYMDVDYEALASVLYRPSSFFIEPAYFVQYSFVYLCYCIFGLGESKLIYRWKDALFVSFGIILSGSGQGILILFVVFIIWIVRAIVKRKIKIGSKIIALIIFFLGLLSLPILLETQLLSKPLDRIFTENSSGGGNAFLARIEGYRFYLELPNLYKVIGMGYGNVSADVYFNSVAYTLYCSGIIGAILVLYIFGDGFLKGRDYQRILTILYFITLFGANTLVGAFLAFYFSFIYDNPYEKLLR